MNVKQLRYVCAIVELGSFSAAAAREGVSVQAVSKAMGEIEGKIGTPLFERESSGVRPTPFGRAFAQRARRVLDEWDGLERFARDGARRVEAGEAPRMGFCCPVYSGVEIFSKIISSVTRRLVGRPVEVVLEPCSRALDVLRSGEVDALITVGPVCADDVTCGTLGTIESCVVLAEGHPLAEKDEVTLDDLGDYPVLDPVGFEHFRSAVLEPYLARGLRSEPVAASGREEVRELFEGRDGYSFMVGGSITGASEGKVTRPIVPSQTVAVPICLTSLKGASTIDCAGVRRVLSRLSPFG